jgi:hypothetical protein
MDKRLGLQGDTPQYPSKSISGADLPDKPHSTISLGDGYFVVLDAFLSVDKRDELLLELSHLIPARKLSK